MAKNLKAKKALDKFKVESSTEMNFNEKGSNYNTTAKADKKMNNNKSCN